MFQSNIFTGDQGIDGRYNGIGVYNIGRRPYQAPLAAPAPTPAPEYLTNPFGTAMSGTKSGTLQPFINRNTQSANNALYGGLLGYQPQQMIAGDAGGTPINPTPPQWSLPSALPTPNQGQSGLLDEQINMQQMFGNRSWMGV